MKVLFVTGEFPPMQGGVGDYTREIALALHHLGLEVGVAASAGAASVPGLSVYPLVRRWDWSCWRALAGLVRRERPAILHIQYQAAAYAMHPAINLLPWRIRRFGAGRPRVIVTFHDLRVPYLFPKAGRARRWVVDELARRSDAAVVTNREDCESLSRSLARPPTLIPIGSNIAPSLPAGYEREAWRGRWGAGQDDFLLCFFGFVNARKGVETLLRALDLLRHPQSGSRSLWLPGQGAVRLLMIGGQTGASDLTNVAYLARMQALIAQLRLGDRVVWTGYVAPEEVSASFLAADLCVLPFRDGASFLHGTFHAALAHGVPVVTTRPEVALPELDHGENVFLVPPEDPQALAEAIARLAGEPELRRRLGEGAGALSTRFGWPAIAAETLKLYQATVGA